MTLTVVIIMASLPSYFPARHHVFVAGGAAIAELAALAGVRFVTAPSFR